MTQTDDLYKNAGEPLDHLGEVSGGLMKIARDTGSEVPQPPDNSAKTIQDLINAASKGRGDQYAMIDKDVLVQSLCAWLVERDERILQHGMEVGKQS
jgi:hypothetical protein